MGRVVGGEVLLLLLLLLLLLSGVGLLWCALGVRRGNVLRRRRMEACWGRGRGRCRGRGSTGGNRRPGRVGEWGSAVAGCSVDVIIPLGGCQAEGFPRGGAAVARGTVAVAVGVGIAVGAGKRTEIVKADVAGDGVAPGKDALGGRGVRVEGGVRAGERVASGAVAVAGGAGVAAAEDFLGESGWCVPRVVAPFLEGAVLAEDFDVAHVVGRDDDVAVRMGRSRDVGGRFAGLGGSGEASCRWGCGNIALHLRCPVLRGWFGGAC